jgi:cytochrome c biogenesis protein CcmG/thiol:disulfide interchange protein DsbE
MIRWLLPLTIVLALGALLYVSLGRDTRTVASPLVGKPMPSFSIPSLKEAAALNSEELRGEPFLLNVWASHCPGCRVEHPLLNQLAAEYGVRIIGLNYKDTPEAALQWLARLGDPYQRIGLDRNGDLGLELGVYGTPETFLVSADGTVLHKQVGPVTTELAQERYIPLFQGGQP